MASMFVREEFLDQMVRFEQKGKLKVRTSLYLLYTDNCGRRVGDWYLDYPPRPRPRVDAADSRGEAVLRWWIVHEGSL